MRPTPKQQRHIIIDAIRKYTCRGAAVAVAREREQGTGTEVKPARFKDSKAAEVQS